MAQYHVGCGIAGIYAGTLKPKKKDEWLNKSDVTNEAIGAVVNHMYLEKPKDKDVYGYVFQMMDGKRVALKLEVLEDKDERT